MSEHTVSASEIGVYEQTLSADTVDTVTFESDADDIEIVSDGAAAIYVTTRGTAPTVGGQNCYSLPALPCARVIHVPGAGETVVKLISEGTPTYSVSRAVAD